MTSFADHRVWQDVYHVPAGDMELYVKFQAGVFTEFTGHVVQGERMMADTVLKIPETMVSPETGETLYRGTRPFVVAYKGGSIMVELPGYYPQTDGEGVHVGDDMAVTDAALRILKEQIDRIPSPATIRRVREKLKLSQREAGGLLRVGENAFDKYERGLIVPSGPTSQLLRLLDRHPELIDELRGEAA